MNVVVVIAFAPFYSISQKNHVVLIEVQLYNASKYCNERSIDLGILQNKPGRCQGCQIGVQSTNIELSRCYFIYCFLWFISI